MCVVCLVAHCITCCCKEEPTPEAVSVPPSPKVEKEAAPSPAKMMIDPTKMMPGAKHPSVGITVVHVHNRVVL